jgi:hypothetical protein
VSVTVGVSVGVSVAVSVAVAVAVSVGVSVAVAVNVAGGVGSWSGVFVGVGLGPVLQSVSGVGGMAHPGPKVEALRCDSSQPPSPRRANRLCGPEVQVPYTMGYVRQALAGIVTVKE